MSDIAPIVIAVAVIVVLTALICGLDWNTRPWDTYIEPIEDPPEDEKPTQLKDGTMSDWRDQ